MATARCLPNGNAAWLTILFTFLLGLLAGYFLLGGAVGGRHALPNSPRFKCTPLTDDESRAGATSGAGTATNTSAVKPDVDADATDAGAAADRQQTDAPVVGVTGNLGMLLPGLVDNVVHYLWCERKVFEFQHYLSVLSVVKAIDPERIVFHYAHYPRHDTQLYNTWFEDMKNEFPYIELDDLGSESPACLSTASQRDYITRLLSERGGFYVHSNTAFFRFPFRFRRSPVTDGLSDGVEGFLAMRRGTSYDARSGLRVERVACPRADLLTKNGPTAAGLSARDETPVCAVRKGPYYPRDAWNRNDTFSAMVNVLLYNSRQTPGAKPSNGRLAPNIGHVIWIGGNEMSFLFYLGCLSHLEILKVDALYVHGDEEPRGVYWSEIKTRRNVVFVKIVKPDLVFRKNIKIINHMADAYRAKILARYGGFYTDSDAVWIKAVPDALRRYDAVASYDWPQMYDLYPDYIQSGVMLGKPGAGYWDLVLEAFKDFRDDIYGYNGLLKPYKLLERHPDLLFVYSKLQVMCWYGRCHPTWYADFRDKDADHRRYPDFKWQDAHAFHWTHPTPDELMNKTALLASDSMFAQIGKHILQAAGKL